MDKRTGSLWLTICLGIVVLLAVWACLGSAPSGEAAAAEQNRQAPSLEAKAGLDKGDVRKLAHSARWLLDTATGASLIDTNVPDWHELFPVDAPPARGGQDLMVYDINHDRIVLFGGVINNWPTTYISDTWELDGDHWPTTYVSDTWEFDGSNWTLISTMSSPTPRHTPGMAYDAGRGVTVLFGGYSPALGNFDETWEYDGSNWVQKFPTNHPSARVGPGMIYDDDRGVIVLFGGGHVDPDEHYNDTWEYDGNDWTLIDTGANRPPVRTVMGLAFDSDRKVTVMYGGSEYSTKLADTWEYDGRQPPQSRWVQMASNGPPPGRTTLVYDGLRHLTTLFGGGLDPIQPPLHNETWVWDGVTWTQEFPDHSPSARVHNDAVFDSLRGRIVLFGGWGTDFSLNGDTWEYGFVDRPWLFLIYLSGDNNLTQAVWPTVTDLTTVSAGITDTHIVVLWDGDEAGDSALYHIADGQRTEVAAPWLGAEADLGDPQTLIDFVQWARVTYPADHTFLSILDHGGGWSPTIQVEPLGSQQPAPDVLFPSLDHYRFKGGTGLSWDYHTGSGDSDYLSTAETRDALAAATNGGAQPLDVLFYDACLMGMMEEAHSLAPYVRYFVASENEAWASSAYDDYLAAIGPATTPGQLATAMVDAYEGSLQGTWVDGHPFTLSALDLSHMGAVSTTFGALAQALYARVSDATLRQQVYTAYLDAQKFDSDSDLVLEAERESYVDLYDLALNLAATVTDTEVVNAANALMAAWDAGLVVAEAHGSGTAWQNGEYWDLDKAHGLSVYLPLGEELTMVITHTSGLTEEVPIRSLYGVEEAPNAAWRDFINAFVAAEWGSPGLEALPARPVAYLDGPRPGLLAIRTTRIYLPLIVRGY